MPERRIGPDREERLASDGFVHVPDLCSPAFTEKILRVSRERIREVMAALGDHDIGIPPEDAPKDFINAASTELLVLENTGHNSFAFPSISALCEKLDNWSRSL